MGSSNQARGIEAIAVRRTTVVDAGKVRYRVYSSPTEFVAVIAESALMAVKVAGVRHPYRIVRDLPTKEIAIEAEKMTKDDTAKRVNFATTPKVKQSTMKADMVSQPASSAQERFVPMHLKDMNSKQKFEGFIVPHEILNQLIDAMRKPAAPEPVSTTVVEATASPVEQPLKPAIQEPSIEMSAPLSEASEVLSKEEVEKLLNGA